MSKTIYIVSSIDDDCGCQNIYSTEFISTSENDDDAYRFLIQNIAKQGGDWGFSVVQSDIQIDHCNGTSKRYDINKPKDVRLLLERAVKLDLADEVTNLTKRLESLSKKAEDNGMTNVSIY
ncbi:MAG: hypothetical protein EOP45_14905 [Sphingobacteriaceae bacterium]|nr:MAG: hypothetical protein EOP45_14905 [Sphingobacteriaceae bacterium]